MTTATNRDANNQRKFRCVAALAVIAGISGYALPQAAVQNFALSNFKNLADSLTASAMITAPAQAARVTFPVATPQIKAESVIGLNDNTTVTTTAKPTFTIAHLVVVKPKPKTAAELLAEKSRRVEDKIAADREECVRLTSNPNADFRKIDAQRRRTHQLPLGELCGG